MSTRHTPAPWFREKGFIYALTENTGSSSRRLPQINRFQASFSAGHNCSDEELEANVRLTLAAPELYAALKTILSQGVCAGSCDFKTASGGCACSLGYAAIAKVEGGAS